MVFFSFYLPFLLPNVPFFKFANLIDHVKKEKGSYSSPFMDTTSPNLVKFPSNDFVVVKAELSPNVLHRRCAREPENMTSLSHADDGRLFEGYHIGMVRTPKVDV